jgi:multiple sugar transport system substrate-binding protein
MHTTKKVLAAVTAVAMGVGFATAQARLTGDLIIFLDTSNPAPRATMEEMIERFQAQHPNLNIETTIIDREAYKTQIRNFLQADPPDVMTWYAANRMKPYVDAGLFEDISDVWQGELSSKLAAAKAPSTQDGKQYAVPYTYYQWGVYYREDLYKKYGLSEPTTWAQMKSNCQTMLDNGHKCYTIGTRFLWTAAGWFDYLNMRTNGYEFHVDLAAGKVAWTDDRVKKTFMNWRELVDMGAFIDDHATYSWQEALPFMVNGDAGAYLMGNFAVAPLLEAGLTEDQLGFYQFPEITPGLPKGEDAPMDTFHIPSGAQNKANAKEFLKYVASADNQSIINDQLGQLPVNADSPAPEDKYLKEGFEILNNSHALAQFFDRDAPAEMAEVAMEGFQEFMVKPGNLDRILDRLEKARQRIY